MTDHSPGGVPARGPDHLIKWFVGVVIVGVGVNVLSGFVLKQKWAWLPPTVFVAALLVAVPRTGLLRRERHGATRWARGLALLALAGYLVVAVWGSLTAWPLAVMILSVAFLWGAGVVLMWSTLRSRADLDEVALGTAGLLMGLAGLLFGTANLLNGWALDGIANLLFGVALLLVGVSHLLGGSTLFGVAYLLHRSTLLGIGILLFGVALLLVGVSHLLGGSTLFGVAGLLVGVAQLLRGSMLFGVAYLLVGVGNMLAGVGLLYRPELSRRVVAWLAKRDDLSLTADRDDRDLLDEEAGRPETEAQGEPGPTQIEASP